MKLCAIYCAWSDCLDLLEKSIENILPVVDGVIVVYSGYSNYGEYAKFSIHTTNDKISFVNYNPTLKFAPHVNETNKRNYGLEIAKKAGYDYFIMMDSDEFYFRDEVNESKSYLKANPQLNGLVCHINVIFAKPTLWCVDHTLVPFIHKLNSNTSVGNFKNYPFTYDYRGDCHIDPTRRVNYTDGIEMCDVIMWHASWYRKDYRIKINNSAARANIMKSSILKDLENAAPGVYNEFYRDNLKECHNYFNI